jgi:hypothetical protein
MSSNDKSTVREAIRTVTPEYIGRPNREMNTIGWSIFLGMMILLVPLLPFMIIVWTIAWLTGRAERKIQE